MNAFLHILTPFLIGLGAIAVIIGLLFLCAWFLSDETD